LLLPSLQGFHNTTLFYLCFWVFFCGLHIPIFTTILAKTVLTKSICISSHLDWNHMYLCMYVLCRNNWRNTNDLWSYNQDYWKVDMIKPLAPGQNVQLNIMSGNLEFKASWWWDICTRINERMCIRMNMDYGL
jgi:hypothetical protein